MPTAPSIEQESLDQFRLSLLLSILLTASVGALGVGLFSLFGLFHFEIYYEIALFSYGVITLLAYILLKKYPRYYAHCMYIGIFASLILFTLMLLCVREDELRLVWFFLVAFSAFILGRRNLGIAVTMLIALIVLALYLYGDIGLSLYALLTFGMALFMFALFAFYFLYKIELDAALLSHRLEEEIAKQQAQEQIMLRKYRMASMGEMIDAIAHQWRQPLAQANMVLLGMDDTIEELSQEPSMDSTQLRKDIATLFGLTAHMSATIDDFRSLLTEDKAKSRFIVEESIDEILTLMKGGLKGIEVSIDLTQHTALFAHRNELSQVFITLLSNSIEALHAKQVDDKQIHIQITEHEERIQISIEDNAGGIPASIAPRIFDPYFSTKESSGGTGLGLYIVQIIIEQSMRGSITHTHGSMGAKFDIILERGS